MAGGGGISFQANEGNIAQEFLEVLKSKERDLLIGINRSYFYGCEENENMRFYGYNKEWLERFCGSGREFYESLLIDREYVEAGITQVYPAYEIYDFKRHFRMFRRIFRDKEIIVVCGDRIFNNISYNIFDCAKELHFVHGPTINAYSIIDEMQEFLSSLPKHKILCFILGPAGKILAYRMFLQGFRVLDIGHSVKDYDWYKKGIQMNWDKTAEFFGPD